MLEIGSLVAAVVTLILAIMDSRKATVADRRDERIDHAMAGDNDGIAAQLHTTVDRLRRHRPDGR